MRQDTEDMLGSTPLYWECADSDYGLPSYTEC
jgi:hypothetical protein